MILFTVGSAGQGGGEAPGATGSRSEAEIARLWCATMREQSSPCAIRARGAGHRGVALRAESHNRVAEGRHFFGGTRAAGQPVYRSMVSNELADMRENDACPPRLSTSTAPASPLDARLAPN